MALTDEERKARLENRFAQLRSSIPGVTEEILEIVRQYVIKVQLKNISGQNVAVLIRRAIQGELNTNIPEKQKSIEAAPR